MKATRAMEMKTSELREMLERLGAVRASEGVDGEAGTQIERLVDAGLRHRVGVTSDDAIRHFCAIGRCFGFATKDDSFGEFEKEFSIIVRRLVVAEAALRSVGMLKKDGEIQRDFEGSDGGPLPGGIDASISGVIAAAHRLKGVTDPEPSSPVSPGEPPPAPRFRDGLISNVEITWRWWQRPWMALRLLFGARVCVQVKTRTENKLGRVENESTQDWSYIPWWPAPTTVGVAEEPKR